jgi:hypothetical protein
MPTHSSVGVGSRLELVTVVEERDDVWQLKLLEPPAGVLRLLIDHGWFIKAGFNLRRREAEDKLNCSRETLGVVGLTGCVFFSVINLLKTAVRLAICPFRSSISAARASTRCPASRESAISAK